MEIDAYLRLAQILTGFSALPSNVATAHLAMLEEAGLTSEVAALAAGTMPPEHAHRRAAFVVIHLWYTGDLPEKLPGDVPALDKRQFEAGMAKKSVEVHMGALLWAAVGAHAPAISGGYFGYWRYPAEN